MKRDFKFETLNGESISNVKGGGGELTKDTHMSQSTDHACGSHGCQSSAGLLINRGSSIEG